MQIPPSGAGPFEFVCDLGANATTSATSANIVYNPSSYGFFEAFGTEGGGSAFCCQYNIPSASSWHTAVYGTSQSDTIDLEYSTGGTTYRLQAPPTLVMGVDVYGYGSNDTIRGSSQATLYDEILFGGDGDDDIEGRAGNDLIFGDGDEDTLNGGPGEDVIYGGTHTDHIYGGDDNDLLYGGTGNDLIWGDDGADVLYGETDSDYLYGGIGDDTLWGSDGDDALHGENGDDVLHGGTGNDFLAGGDDDDILCADEDYAGWPVDTLIGGYGSDVLWGFAGKSTIGDWNIGSGGPARHDPGHGSDIDSCDDASLYGYDAGTCDIMLAVPADCPAECE